MNMVIKHKAEACQYIDNISFRETKCNSFILNDRYVKLSKFDDNSDKSII